MIGVILAVIIAVSSAPVADEYRDALALMRSDSPAPMREALQILREDLPGRIPISPRDSETAGPITAEAPRSGPRPFSAIDDRTGPPRLEGVLTEAEMVGLIAAYFPTGDRAWALDVAHCESRWDTWAENPRSTAAGLWQFLRSTWDWVAGETGTGSYSSGAVFDAHSQALNAAWLLANGGKSHWECKSGM